MKKHITLPYLLDPAHLITVALVGVGGTGSQVLNGLVRLHIGLQAIGHPGIHVTAYDDDQVSESNIGRQLFYPTDAGVNKAMLSISRINRSYGFAWQSVPEKYSPERKENIIVSCTDTVSSRMIIHKTFSKGTLNEANLKTARIDHETNLYWLDLGNTRSTGQVVLGCNIKAERHRLPTVCDLFDLSSINEKDQGPSCSLAQAILRQDLFVNPTLAYHGCNLLWKLFSKGSLDHQGLYLNLETMSVRPIPITA